MVLMALTTLLRETLDADCDEVGKNERTLTPVRVFGMHLYLMGLPIREVV